MGDSPRCHSMVELNDHPGVEESTWSYKMFQGLPMHNPHGIFELRIDNKSWKIIICFVVHFFGTVI